MFDYRMYGFPKILNEGLTQPFLSLGLWDGSSLSCWHFKARNCTREGIPRQRPSIVESGAFQVLTFFCQCHMFSDARSIFYLSFLIQPFRQIVTVALPKACKIGPSPVDILGGFRVSIRLHPLDQGQCQ